MRSDPAGVALTYLGAAAVLLIVRWLRNHGWPLDITRKLVHVTAGLWMVGCVYILETWLAAIFAPATFVVLNSISLRRNWFSGIESGDPRNLGLPLFPASFAGVLAFFWITGRPELAIPAFMPLALGDAAAGLFGRRWITRRYLIFGNTRSVGGSLAMLLFSFVAVAAALAFTKDGLSVTLLGVSLLTAILATVAEMLSPYGADNLTIPLTSSLVIYLYA